MKLISREKALKPRRKIFTALGGKNKNHIRKGEILGNMLKTLSLLLKKFITKSELNQENKKVLNSIKHDIDKISEYQKTRKMNFYFLCLELIKKYNINKINLKHFSKNSFNKFKYLYI